MPRRYPADVRRQVIERFRAGLDRRAEFVGPFAVGSDGAIWFRIEKRRRQGRGNERGSTAIGRIVPPRKPPNTFLVLAPKRQRGSAEIRLPVVTPGPGALRLHACGRRSITRRAHGSGTTFLPVRRDASAARITFTPRRGSPDTQRIKLR